MKIIYTEGPAVYDTDGQGQIFRGVAREIDDQYGFNLIQQSIVEAADDASLEKVHQMRAALPADPLIPVRLDKDGRFAFETEVPALTAGKPTQEE